MSEELYDDVTRLTMLTFMITLLSEYDRDNFSHLLSDRLKSVIQNLHVTSADT